MSDNLRRALPILQFVSEVTNKRLRTLILKELSKKPHIYKAIKELVTNTMKQNIKLPHGAKIKLKKHAGRLQQFTKKSVSKRKLVVQSGGFLPILIPLLASLLKNLNG